MSAPGGSRTRGLLPCDQAGEKRPHDSNRSQYCEREYRETGNIGEGSSTIRASGIEGTSDLIERYSSNIPIAF